jgi:hypothetical protein
MTPYLTIGLSWTGAVFAFLLVAWVNNSIGKEILKLRLEIAQGYVSNAQWVEVKSIMADLTARMTALQILFAQRGIQALEDQHPR